MKKKIRVAVFCILLSFCIVAVPDRAYAQPEDGTTVRETTDDDMQQSPSALSGDNTLSSLKIAQAALEPEFSSEQLTYTVTIPNDVTRIALVAETSDPEATKVIKGTGDLLVGENAVTVVVTAQNGSVREYRINVIRETGAISGESQTGESGIPMQTDPTGSESVDPGLEQTDSQESGSETEEMSDAAGVIFPGGEAGDAMHGGEEKPTETAVSGQTQKDSLSVRKIVILILLVFILVLIFVIIAIALLSKTQDEEADDDDDAAGQTGADDGGSYDALESGSPQGSSASEDGAEAGSFVTPEELARFYRTLNAEEPETTAEEALGTAENGDLEILDLDEDESSLEEDRDFDFLDF